MCAAIRKIAVLNGSPKGKYSITMQTVLYLQKRFSGYSHDTIPVGRQIKSLEKDISAARDVLRGADLVLFAYPVYTFLVPYQLHRFVELLREQGVDLRGKYAAQITTSKHFFDVTAHRFIEQNCADLGMKYIGGLSADMDDLLCERGRREAEQFWEYVCFCADNDLYRKAEPVPDAGLPGYRPRMEAVPKTGGYDTVIVTNCAAADEPLAGMIADFRAAYPHESRVVNIADYPFSGGCLGCLNCATDGKCVYKDGFDDFLRTEIQRADAMVCAFTIKDHSMGAGFKLYDDRQFCNGHRTVNMGMPVGYIVRGNYAAEQNLQMVVEGRCEVGRNFLAGVATDAEGVGELSAKLAYALETGLTQPQNFYGVGGMRIFRDLIYMMRGMMKADHRFFKKHGLYDFPQKKLGTTLQMQLVGALLSSAAVRRRMGGKMNDGMVAPYRKVIERAEPRP